MGDHERAREMPILPINPELLRVEHSIVGGIPALLNSDITDMDISFLNCIYMESMNWFVHFLS
jgi:hypothetical protein